MRLGIAHHLGWAVAVTADADHEVVDRRRMELIETGLPAAPIHHEGGPHLLHRKAERLTDDALAALVGTVRTSAIGATAAALDDLARTLPAPVVSMSLRAWPADFPTDIAVQRRVPYEARADSVMYRQVLAELGRARGWSIHLFDASDVEAEAARVLGDRADEVLHGPRATLGPPWSKDHRIASDARTAMVEGPPDRARRDRGRRRPAGLMEQRTPRARQHCRRQAARRATPRRRPTPLPHR